MSWDFHDPPPRPNRLKFRPRRRRIPFGDLVIKAASVKLPRRRKKIDFSTPKASEPKRQKSKLPKAKEERGPRPARIGWRLATLGITFLLMFGVLFTRLWFVQIAAGEAYAAEVENQIVRTFRTSAPRGVILDRNGTPLATSRYELAIVVDRTQIPEGGQSDLVQRLSLLVEVPAAEIQAHFDTMTLTRFVLPLDVDSSQALTLLEQKDQYLGASIEEVPERVYLTDSLSHVIGHIGRPDANDIEANPDLDPSTVIGKAGVEAQYDEALQGVGGLQVYRVNANDDVLETLRNEPAEPGTAIVLTADLELQHVVEDALIEGVQLARRISQRENPDRPAPKRGAVVVLDPQDFSVLAMASYPSFDPAEFVGGLDIGTFDLWTETGAFNNLAIQGLYPPASTFKAVTYLVALEQCIYPTRASENTDEGVIDCGPRLIADFADESRRAWNDWNPAGHGPLDLHGAFERSCNVYFWEVALRIHQERNDKYGNENLIQEQAHDLGFGEATGIDLPFERSGIVPDRDLFNAWADAGDLRLDANRIQPGQEVWYGGDLLQTAVGQGATLATPLQVAASYGAIINGGTFYQPHVVSEIRDGAGNTVTKFEPTVVRDLPLSSATIRSFKDDMGRVTRSGTAAKAFEAFGESVADVGGKTGTAETPEDRNSHAWFVGAGPMDNPRFVVAVLVEEGGSGGRVAAPIARHIMQYLMGEEPTPIEAGEDAD